MKLLKISAIHAQDKSWRIVEPVSVEFRVGRDRRVSSLVFRTQKSCGVQFGEGVSVRVRHEVEQVSTAVLLASLSNVTAKKQFLRELHFD